METFAFYFFATLITVLFSITVLSRNILYAMTSLAGGMVLISGLFFILGADFLGVVQLIVYVGAVMALYAFGMMFFDASKIVQERKSSALLVFLLGGMSALILVVIFAAPVIGENVQALYPPVEGATNPQAVGLILFTKYLVPFEVAAIMLLVAMIAGIVLAGKKMDASLSRIIDTELEETLKKEKS